ncbi:MAG: hypothetical protein JWO32_38 [Bacteroidetes bacterium]|nr:hypothetical protein [Bacteroidota bacterium]
MCSSPTPFCTGQTMQFPAGVNAGSAQTGPNYGCLGSQPNPAWFYFQAGTAGPLVITMSAGSDIDYIAYGPFSSLTGNCGNLTAANTVGCSYSGSATETLTIANAVAGQFYLLMITNFANVNQQISFSQTNSGAAGAAQTNCGVLCTMTVTGTASLCPGKTGTLSATTGTGVTSVTWNGPAGYTSTGNNAIVPNITSTSVFTAVAATSGTASCSLTKTITVLPVPVPAPANNGPLCAGQTLNLSVNAMASYTWSGPGGFNSNLQNPTASPGVAGTYSVKVTSAAGCTNIATTTVSIINSPTATPFNNGPVCAGSSLALTGSGGGTYLWTGPNGFSSTLQNPNITNVTTAASGTYTLLVTVGSCTASQITSVTINPKPTPLAGSNSPVCVNNSINFTGSGGTSYAWTGPAGFSSILQNPVITPAAAVNAGSYSLTVTNAAGCLNTISTNVTVSPLPVVAVTNPAACLNQPINLSANGGNSYAWSGPLGYSSTVQNPVISNAQLNMSGNYTVVVTSAAGCTASAISNVTVFTLPNPSITSNTPCAGASLTFTAAGGATYSWSGPNAFSATGQNPVITNVSMAANGIYTLVASAGTCSASITQSITVNPLSLATAASNNPVCVNTNINLSGTGGNSYVWSGPNSFISSVQNPVITSAQANNSGIYSLTVTSINGCASTASTNVTVNALPVVVVTNPTVCTNQTINLSATGGVLYSWSGPLGFNSTLQNPSIPNASTLMAGPYTVIVTSASSCTASNVSNVSVYALPTPAIIHNTPCVGSALTFTGSGGASYNWAGPNGFTSATQNPTILNVGLSANGAYTLIATAGSCSNAVTSNVVINPLPSPIINSNNPVCLNQSLTFTASGGSVYNWTGPNGFTASGSSIGIPSANLGNSGLYVVTVTNSNNCTNTISISATVNPLPVIAITGATVCVPRTISLTANGGVSYSWVGPAGFSSNSSNPVITNSNLGMNGQYSVTVTDANSCISTSITSVQVNSIPSPTAASNSPVCANQTLALSSGAQGAAIYVWTGPGGYFSSTANPQIISASPNMSGSYTVTVTDNAGCSSNSVIAVTVNPLPLGEISSDKLFGCFPLCISYTCQAPSGLQTCTWDFGQGSSGSGISAVSCYNSAGTFTIRTHYTDNNNCSNSSTYTIQAYPVPTADFNYAPQKPVVNEEVQFTNASYGGNVTGWQWNFSHLSNTVSAQPNPALIYENAGEYVVALIITTDKGCVDTIIKKVVIGEDYGIFVPNAFTPNGDGVNDVFQPKGFGIVKYELNVFDRWGEKIFSTNKFEEGWAGNYRGRSNDIVPVGVYVWQIRLRNVFGKSKELTGQITVEK